MITMNPTPSPVATAIWEQLADWHPGIHGNETDPRAHWEISAVFHHDFEYHLLVQQWAPNGSGTYDPAGFSLWFVPIAGPVVYVDEWTRGTEPPLVTAGGIVMLRRREAQR